MKTKNIYLTLLALLGFIVTSCSHFDDLNTDPNKSTNLDPGSIIPTVQLISTPGWQGQHRLFIYPGGFMNQWTGDYSVVEYGGIAQKYKPHGESFWLNYGNVIKNVVDIVERSKDDPELVNIYAMARILKVQNFMRLTDYYGDLPYTEAGMGYHGGIYKPKYDKQEDVYNDFLKELKEAAASFDNGKLKPTVDHYYDGDLNKWKKYANSLRLRIAMRLVKVDINKAKNEALAAIASGVFASNDEMCLVKYENKENSNDGDDKGNPIANLISGRSDAVGSTFYLGADLIKIMEDLNDPRIRYYGGVFFNDLKKTDVTDQVYAKRGNKYAAMCVPSQMFAYQVDPSNPYPGSGSPIEIIVDGKSYTPDLAYTRMRPSKLISAYDSPVIHMSYAEIEFLQAEMAQRGWIAEADAHFKKGIEAAIMQWTLFGANVDPAAANAYANSLSLTSGSELDQINTQLYILHFLDPVETWANWRRSGYPNLRFNNHEPDKNDSGGERPRRMEYPIEENLKNATNLKAAVDRIGSDDWMKRVWWDKQ